MTIMWGDFGFFRHLTLFLFLLYATVGGHWVCCAYYHPAKTEPNFVVDTLTALRHSHHHHDCTEHHHHHSSEDDTATCCSSAPCDHEHVCKGKIQPAIVVPRNVDEQVNLSKDFSAYFISDTPTEDPSVQVGYHDTIAFYSSALPVRLHLLYRTLLI